MKVYQKINITEVYDNRLSILLVITTALLLAWLVAIWVRPARLPIFEAENSRQVEGVLLKKELPGRGVYNVIVDKDIFRVSRRKFVSNEGLGPVKRVLSEAPKLVLLGTVILDDYRAAMISYRNKKDGAKYYRVGSTIDGFVIEEIGKDFITLTRGSESIAVNMNEQDTVQQKDKRRPKRVRQLANSLR